MKNIVAINHTTIFLPPKTMLCQVSTLEYLARKVLLNLDQLPNQETVFQQEKKDNLNLAQPTSLYRSSRPQKMSRAREKICNQHRSQSASSLLQPIYFRFASNTGRERSNTGNQTRAPPFVDAERSSVTALLRQPSDPARSRRTRCPRREGEKTEASG